MLGVCAWAQRHRQTHPSHSSAVKEHSGITPAQKSPVIMNDFKEAVWFQWLFWSWLNHQTFVIFYYSSIWAWVGRWEKPTWFEELHNSDFISFFHVYDYSYFTWTKYKVQGKKKKKENICTFITAIYVID